MLRVAALILAACPARAEPVAAPSGQLIELIEAFWDLTQPDVPTLRLRFVAPEIGAARGIDEVDPDFLHLCQTVGATSVPPERNGALVVVSLADRPLPFGTFDPDVTQFFEGFRVKNGACIWEPL